MARVYWSTISKSEIAAGIQALRDAGDTETFQELDPEGPLGTMMSDDSDIAVEIDGTPWVAQKVAAMRAHATQITPTVRFSPLPRCSAMLPGPRVLPPGQRPTTSSG